ncbi:type II secretion system F family protein [Corynebacterium senegalense]|uniref:type II secretion system F family protein n=1 Tax=Corynebacterium senegalense TaxID=2080750 RepID=UPI000E207EF5|nr:type II secretion system F family protein [Corynebacterium senegalense]
MSAVASAVIPALLLAGALAVPAPGAFARVLSEKTPRDGPALRLRPAGVDRHRAAADIELFAACFRAGLPAASAAAAVAESYGADPGPDSPADPWRTVAALSALGVETQRAWAEMHRVPGGAELAALIALSSASGSAVAAGCERIAAGLREGAADDAKARAERAGVLIALPLTAFFLPAFFVLGLAPVVIGLAGKLT